MAGRMFGTVENVSDEAIIVRFDSGEMPEKEAAVQVLSGLLAARGCLATDDHHALTDAREAVCAAIRAQVQKPGTYERQREMIAVLQRIDHLLAA